jgi:hypothetical protein
MQASNPFAQRFSLLDGVGIATCLTGLWSELPWGHQTKTPNELRKASMQRGKRRQGAFVVFSDENRRAQWGPQSDACIDCGTTERPHRAHGRCKRCDDKWRYRD